MSYTVAPLLGGWMHPLLVTMVSTALITVAMTWVVMPALVPLFANWLYPAAAETAAPAQPPSEDS
jgi:antibiotic biosynthesis monooxygenase (ABM) superfamily enzyme